MSQTAKILIAVTGAFFVLILAALLAYFKFPDQKVASPEFVKELKESGTTLTEIPEEILANKFGFLGGHPGDTEFVLQTGAKWVRPHLGPFLWESMQSAAGENYDFDTTDEMVERYQESGIGLLITLWPYAEWDLENRSDYADCAVSTQDEFLADIRDKDNMYLPLHRCNPYDWDAYSSWVSAVVERYDGDGKSDMPGLLYPIKHWEAMNEPDLSWEGSEVIDTRLDFYQEGPEEYAELLKRTYEAIKAADQSAQVLIAGAAGGNESFLEFYRQVFSVDGIENYFDIANVHCISNDEYENYNVVPYSGLLTEFGIDKPIWVTEAEAIVHESVNENAEQAKVSTQNAIEAGASMIFYTRFGFEGEMFESEKPPEGEDKKDTSKDEKDMDEGIEKYQEIILEY